MGSTESVEERIAAELGRRPRMIVGVLDIRVDVAHLGLTEQGQALLLEELATRLEGSTRETDPKRRISADRFMVILPGLGRPADVELVAEGVHRAVRGPYDTAKGQIDAPVYVGAATSKSYVSAAHLLKATINAAEVGAAQKIPVHIADGGLVETIERHIAKAFHRRHRHTDTSVWTGARTERGWRSMADAGETVAS